MFLSHYVLQLLNFICTNTEFRSLQKILTLPQGKGLYFCSYLNRHAMTHSLKNTWITIFSILAMLMSNFVSSAPMMAMNSLLYSSSEIPTDHHIHTSPINVEFVELDNSSHEQTNCHSSSDPVHTSESNQVAMSHCGDSNTNVDACCVSVCSSVSYPTEVAYSPSTLSSTLALHHSIKIGVKVSRIQSLLRPPSA